MKRNFESRRASRATAKGNQMRSPRKKKCPHLVRFGAHLFTSSIKIGDGPRYETCSWCGAMSKEKKQ